MKKLYLKNIREMKARKAQFGALIVLVALGISTYVSFITGYINLSVSTEYAYDQLKFEDFSVKVIRAPKSITHKIQAVRGVEAVEGRLIVDTGLYINDDEQVQARIISIPTEQRPMVNDLLVFSGRYLSAKAKDTCLIENQYANERKIKIGDIVRPLSNGEKRELTVAGIISSPEYFYSISSKGEIPTPGGFAVIYMAQNEVERIWKRPPSYNSISITIKDGADRDRIINEVEDILDPFSVIETVEQEDQPSNFSLQEEIRQNQSFAYMMPFVILFIAALSLFIALSRLVQSQRGEIGLAKALGYRDWQIVVHYLVYSIMIATGGSIAGFILGDILAREITKLYVDFLGIPYFKHQMHPQTIFGSVVLSTIACMLAGIVPAYASAKLAPANAMRADPNIGQAKGSVPLIERALSKMFHFSFTVKIPLRNVFRAKRRSLYTVIGISFALLLTVSTWAMFDAMDYLFDVQFNRVEKWDMAAGFSTNFSGARVNQIESWRGVKKVEPVLVVPVEIRANGKMRETAITAMDPDAAFHGFDISGGPSAKRALEMGGVIMTPLVAGKMGLKIGDTFKVETPYIKDRELTLRLLAFSDEMIGTPIFIGLEQGRKILRAPNVYNSVYLDVEGRYATDIKKKMYDLPGAVSVIVKQKMIDQLNELMSFSYIFFGIMLAFAFTMAFVVVYNTFTANILERLREIATMRTIGEDRWHLALMVTLENLILALIGIPLGIWLGVMVAGGMFKSMSSEAFTLYAVIYPKSYFWIVSSILMVLLISEIPPTRRIFKLDLAESTKILE